MLTNPFVITGVSPDFVEFDEDEEVEELQSAKEWLKEYSTYAGPKSFPLTLEQVREAVTDEFPELIEAKLGLDELLDKIGIHFVGDYREFIIAWYGVIGEENANVLLEKYQQLSYLNIRKKLGIDYLWILKLDSNFGYSANAIF
ncbi:MAG: hypothetical protein HC852_22180 [Acaryochloridaceae cyanobacterium RU_4_10]|nr:hypothetical protein [Acaryochloridaceae cyanobacterium RU_4_10]